GVAGRQLSADCRHHGPEWRKVQTVQRRDRRSRRGEGGRLRGGPPHPPPVPGDGERGGVAPPTPPGPAADRHPRESSRGGRRFAPSWRRSSSSGGRAKRMSVWWVKGDRLIPDAGGSR